MSRTVRVNELLKREISHILHTRYQAEAVHVTVLDVDVTPNLRAAKVYYSTVGEPWRAEVAERFFAQNHRDIRKAVGKAVVLKYLPRFDFVYDDAPARGQHINAMLDAMGYTEDELDPPDDALEAQQ